MELKMEISNYDELTDEVKAVLETLEFKVEVVVADEEEVEETIDATEDELEALQALADEE